MFKFNKNYKDLKQVERFYPDFKKIYNNITAEGYFAYNSLFEGKIKGIEGKDEDTAIYLLQQLETQKNRDKKIEGLLKDGFKKIETGEGIKKFKKVVMVGTDYSRDSIKEFEKAKILFEKGYANFIIPKGYSKRGIILYPDRLVFAK